MDSNSRNDNATGQGREGVTANQSKTKVGELIEKADMRKTNLYGEPKSPSMTFKEYIAHRAESYMTEEVAREERRSHRPAGRRAGIA